MLKCSQPLSHAFITAGVLLVIGPLGLGEVAVAFSVPLPAEGEVVVPLADFLAVVGDGDVEVMLFAPNESADKDD